MEIFMKKIMRYISILLCLVLIFAQNAFAETENAEDANGSVVKLTETLAITVADDFANACTETDLKAVNPIKFYDETGRATGYILSYLRADKTAGYIVLDKDFEGLVAEYSFDEKTKNPYEAIIQNNPVSQRKVNNNEFSLYRTAPFTYCIIDEESQKIYDNYGNNYESDKVAKTKSSALQRSQNQSHWNDIFVNISDGYNLMNSNHLSSFSSVSERDVERTTQHYACAVSAMINCAEQYGIYSWGDSLRRNYMRLWELSGTSEDSNNNGITYGATPQESTGPAFVNFCGENGVYISQALYNNASYDTFVQCINSGNPAILSVGIYDADDGGAASGHAMAVEGYAILGGGYGGYVNALMVADGWGNGVRYVNYNFSKFYRKAGIIFYR